MKHRSGNRIRAASGLMLGLLLFEGAGTPIDLVVGAVAEVQPER